MKSIFDQINIKNLKLKNRLVRSATWEGIAKKDGSLPEEIYDIYEELAKGGVGTIITGFTSVDSNDFYFDGMMRLAKDELIPQYKRLVDIVHSKNCKIITQLALGAYYRKIQNDEYLQIEPDIMTINEINYVINLFVDAAKRAEIAGFDGVQIHAAHFFFLSRFISPAINKRKDEYGITPENRSRILIEILNRIRQKVPSLHISIKINSNDFTYNGLNEDESLIICKLLDDAGIDSIEVSGNGTSVRGIKPKINEGYFVPFAKILSESVKCQVIFVGGFRSKEIMENVLINLAIK